MFPSRGGDCARNCARGARRELRRRVLEIRVADDRVATVDALGAMPRDLRGGVDPDHGRPRYDLANLAFAPVLRDPSREAPADFWIRDQRTARMLE